MVADDLFQLQLRLAALDSVVDKANIVRPALVEFVDFVVADTGRAIDLMADTVIVLSRYLTANMKRHKEKNTIKTRAKQRRYLVILTTN